MGGCPDQVAAGADSRESLEPCGHGQVCVWGQRIAAGKEGATGCVLTLFGTK